MTSYIPEYWYGFTGWDKHNQPTHGLIPWPKHMTPRGSKSDPRETGSESNPVPSGVELTKKGEAYVAKAAGETINLTVNSHDRLQLSTTIEQLINMLDDLDDDPDIEENGDELDAAANDRWRHRQGMEVLTEDHEPSLGQEGTWTDAGLMYDLEEDRADDEPSLGATEAFNQEVDWREDDCWHAVGEGEPYLGWSEHHGRGVTFGENGDDREQDCEDEGAQCDDEGVIEGITFI